MAEPRPRVALFVTCLVDLYRPTVGFAAITTALAAAVLTADDDVHAGHDHAHLDDETLDRVRGPIEPDRVDGGAHEPDWDDFGPRAAPL